MLHIRRLMVTLHRRKRHIVWLLLCSVLLFLCIPLLNSISLWEGNIVNSSFQHQITEIIGILFLLYFWSTIFTQFNDHKTLQLLWSKKKSPSYFLWETRLGIFTIYSGYIIITLLWAGFLQGFTTETVLSYINLLMSGSIILTLVMLLSLATNPYASMIWSLIIYSVSYSINFILFSTPIGFKEDISYQALLIIQYMFPRFDLLYSMTWYEWLRSLLGNGIYMLCLYGILSYVFLSLYDKK
jgi:hypothetical protein